MAGEDKTSSFEPSALWVSGALSLSECSGPEVWGDGQRGGGSGGGGSQGRGRGLGPGAKARQASGRRGQLPQPGQGGSGAWPGTDHTMGPPLLPWKTCDECGGVLLWPLGDGGFLEGVGGLGDAGGDSLWWDQAPVGRVWPESGSGEARTHTDPRTLRIGDFELSAEEEAELVWAGVQRG